MRIILAVATSALLVGCELASGGSYAAGYKDGYAVGYNTACEIRFTLVQGDWHLRNYSHGYSEGVTAGIQACNHDRRNR